jgi:hypothetical protein
MGQPALSRSIAAAIAAVILGAGSAGATPDQAREGIWTVIGFSSSCAAFNRPPVEYNTSPFNSLYIKLSREGALTMQVAFWPGYVDPAGTYRLALGTEAAPGMTVPAKPLSFAPDYAVETDPSDTAALRDALSHATTLTTGLGGNKPSLVFDIEALPRVLPLLDACVKKLTP